MDARQTNSAHGVDPRAHQPWPYPEQHRINSAAPTPSWVPTSMPHIPADTPKGPHVPHMAESHDTSIPAHPHDNVFQRPILTNSFDDTAALNPQAPNDGSGRKYDETSHAPIPIDPGVANSAHFTPGLPSSNDWIGSYPTVSTIKLEAIL
ncbi:hypothetical protein OF83DRAFT_1086254 [Amylostereum chailletii]|nr:hypothetical protein OF83DRAFT_1086254 [Amylostereum chailletii]